MLNCFLARAQRIKGFINPPPTENNEVANTQTDNNQRMDMDVQGMTDPTKIIKAAMKRCIEKTHSGFCEFPALVKEVKGKYDEKVLRAYLNKMLNDGLIMNMNDEDVFVLLETYLK